MFRFISLCWLLHLNEQDISIDKGTFVTSSATDMHRFEELVQTEDEPLVRRQTLGGEEWLTEPAKTEGREREEM